MTVPVWVWAVSAGGVIAAVAAEIVLTGRRGLGTVRSGSSGALPSGSSGAGTTARQAIGWVAVYMSLAAACGLGIGVTAGWVTAGQFYAGYLTEYSLSLDNLFVFAVIMTWFAVPPARQPRVLLFGIGLALAMRSAVIVAGAAALNRFGWLFYPLGGVLLWTAVGLIASARSRPDRQAERHARLMTWLRRRPRRPGPTGSAPMLVLAAAIGLADLLFAFDSIPAVFGITTSAALVVACNAFALMGLRQLYTLVAELLGRIVYMNTGLGVICAFIGISLLLRGSGTLTPAWLSVLAVTVVLLVTVLAGMIGGSRPLSAAERMELERRFAIIDADANGVWQSDDYQLLTRRLCETFGHTADSAAGRAVATAQRGLFDALLAHLDANDDQEITWDEFVAGLGRTIQDRPGFDTAVRTTAQTLIQVADQDANGVLDAEEYTRLAAVYGARPDEAERAFDWLDHDQNGVLGTAELARAISQFFVSRDLRARGNLAFGHL
jgi:tellurite resistance protein TerC